MSSTYTRLLKSRSSRRRLTPLAKKKILCLYHEGFNNQQIAIKVRCTDMTVFYELKKAGLVSQARQQTDMKKAGVLELHNQGLTRIDIGLTLGMSYDTVKRVLTTLKLKANRRCDKYLDADGKKICRQCGVSENDQGFCKASYSCNRCHYLSQMNSMHSLMNHRFCVKRCNARAKDIAFTLTFEQFMKMYNDQGGLCAYTRKPMNILYGEGMAIRGQSISVDRLQCDGIYEYSNVVLCCHRANATKRQKSVSELPELWQANLKEVLAKRT